MPTLNPRITFTVSDELMDKIDEYRFQHRMKNQTQAIVSLLNLGLEALSDKPVEQLPKFTEDEVQLISEYRAAIPMAQDMARTTLRNYPAKQEKSRA